MEITIIQKIQLSLVFAVIKLLWWFDDIVDISKKSFLYIIRASMYLIIVSVLLTGFMLETSSVGLSSLPLSFNPKPEVLGTSVNEGIVLTNLLPLPEITAKAVYATDTISNKTLLEINSSQKYPPASVTKLMTALVALDLYEMSEVLIIPEFCTQIEGQKAGLLFGDSYKVIDLLTSMLVSSSADAACTLSLGKVTYNEFIQQMNKKANDLGLKDTYFTNPVGLDGENGSHFSTAYDLYLLSKYAVENDLIKNLVGTKESVVVGSLGLPTSLVNTNDLLWEREKIVGIKTGRTEGAGEVLTFEYVTDDADIIISLMQSENRFEDGRKILDWLLASYAIN